MGRKERKERGEEEEKSFRYEEEDPDMFMCVSGVCVWWVKGLNDGGDAREPGFLSDRMTLQALA